jgi:hypothetical protein
MSHADTETALLGRMALTRTELLAGPALSELPRVRPARRPVRTPGRSGPWFLQTPNAELIALTLVALVVLGVRRTIQGVVTAGVSASTHRALTQMLSGDPAK